MSMDSAIGISRDGAVKPTEIEELRAAVGWDRAEGTYARILLEHYTYYTARSQGGRLIGFVSIISDGISDAFLIDLMVHPEYQRQGIGTRMVKWAIRDIQQAGIRCIQVTFDEHLEEFYAKCGFHIFRGGVIDFNHMKPMS